MSECQRLADSELPRRQLYYVILICPSMHNTITSRGQTVVSAPIRKRFRLGGPPAVWNGSWRVVAPSAWCRWRRIRSRPSGVAVAAAPPPGCRQKARRSSNGGADLLHEPNGGSLSGLERRRRTAGSGPMSSNGCVEAAACPGEPEQAWLLPDDEDQLPPITAESDRSASLPGFAEAQRAIELTFVGQPIHERSVAGALAMELTFSSRRTAGNVQMKTTACAGLGGLPRRHLPIPIYQP